VKAAILVLLALLAVPVVSIAYIRLAPIKSGIWHIDPAEFDASTVKNAYLLGANSMKPAPKFPVSAKVLAEIFHQMALAQHNVNHIAGDPENGWMTYVQRSRVIGFPDFITVRIDPLAENRSSLTILSRSRFGQNDLGVNKARVMRFLKRLQFLIDGAGV
jgi:uncharacterized protein (DUF1499 family)